MSRFYVGQRVRIKFSDNHPSLIGTIGTISVIDSGCLPPEDGHVPVIPDAWGSLRCPDKPGVYFSPREEYLEPATDSYGVTSWDTCAWKPEHLRVGV